ncbi:MAG: InlB B-repeat-containing protein [Clostridiales Family XIII bacterium]|jgi:hypothetical protein|nr:InlB B-repeat-containing protein [Clostridiales Family XIII bacterium]
MKKHMNEAAKIRCMGCMREYEDHMPDGSAVTVCPFCGYVKDAPAKEVYHLTPGTVLQGKYIVGKVLGYGGFGVTYIGFDAQLDRKIAIKEYLPTNFSTRMAGETKLTVYDGENGEQFHAGLNSFVEEAKRLMKFNALSGTVDIYDSFMQNGTGYIVMEYLEGKTVKETLAANGVFEYEAAKAIVLRILNTLKEVHKAGIVHRDIAPDNIFILPGGDVRLIDFGASRYATTLHSKSLSVILKPGYAPEEQYRSRGKQGSWSDVYALAATFYKMITGITPEESMERMMKDELKEPSKLGVKLPQNDENAIMNALLVKPSDRTQNAGEFERQLTAEDEVRRAASTVVKYDAGKVPRWTKLLASCLAAAVVVFGVLLATGVVNLENGAFASSWSGKAALAEDEVRVPNVIKVHFDAAQTIADDTPLLLVITDKQFSDKVEAGLVLTQDPLPGRILLMDSALSVVVSAGEEVAIVENVMPDVVFRTLEDALAMLGEAGIEYEIVREESDTVAKDSIIRSDIEAGQAVGVGKKITLVVSDGSKKQETAQKNTASSPKKDIPQSDTGGAAADTGTGKNSSAGSKSNNTGNKTDNTESKTDPGGNSSSGNGGSKKEEAIPIYTLSFDGNKNTEGNAPASIKAKKGESVKLPGEGSLARTNYIFLGWAASSRASDVEYAAGSQMDLNGNVKLYAVWIKEKTNPPIYTVTFSGNGNTGGSVPSSLSAEVGDSVTIPGQGSLYRTNCNFLGWSESPGGAVADYVSGSRVVLSGNMNLYAVWVEMATLTYSGNGNTGGSAPSSVTVRKGDSITLPGQGSLLRTFYTFLGWSTLSNASSASYSANSSVAVGSNMTLYAVWRENTWSGWVTSLPSNVNASNYAIESKTQYSYRDKSTTTNTTGITPSGYTLESKVQSGYTAWSSWSDWSKTNPGAITEIRDVELRTIPAVTKTQYWYEAWINPARTLSYPYNPGGWNYNDSRNTYVGIRESPLPFDTNVTLPNGQTYASYASWNGSIKTNWWNQHTDIVTVTPAYSEWRYRTRSPIYTYTYYKWSAWSSWSDAVVSASSTREVQTQIVYRYRLK